MGQEKVTELSFCGAVFAVALVETSLASSTSLLCVAKESSKTFITFKIVEERLRRSESGKKAIVLTNNIQGRFTKDLTEAIKLQTPLKAITVSNRSTHPSFDHHDLIVGLDNTDIIFTSAAELLEILKLKIIPLSHIALVVIDNCHLTSTCTRKGSLYAAILQHFRLYDEEGRIAIVGLTSDVLNLATSKQQLKYLLETMESVFCCKASVSSDLLAMNRFGEQPLEKLLILNPELQDTHISKKLSNILNNSIHCLEGTKESENPIGITYVMSLLSECYNVLVMFGAWSALQAVKFISKEVLRMEKKAVKSNQGNVCLALRSCTTQLGKMLECIKEEEELLSTEHTLQANKLLSALSVLNSENNVKTIETGGRESQTDDSRSNHRTASSVKECSMETRQCHCSQELCVGACIEMKSPLESGAADVTRDSCREFVDRKGPSVSQSMSTNTSGRSVDKLKGHCICVVLSSSEVQARAVSDLINNISKSTPEFSYLRSRFLSSSRIKQTGSDADSSPDAMVESHPEKLKHEPVMQQIQEGVVNVLVVCHEVEEELHLSQCCLVIRFGIPKNYLSYVGVKRIPKCAGAEVILIETQAKWCQTEMHHKMFQDIEQYLLKRCPTCQLPAQIVAQALDEKKLSVYEPFGKQGPCVTAKSSIALINSYCLTFPNDGLTHPIPHCRVAELEDGEHVNITSTLYLPRNCPISQPFEGVVALKKEDVNSTTFATARLESQMLAALKACEALHKAGELNDHLEPSSRCTQFVFKGIDEPCPYQVADGGQGRPGSMKRKRAYERKFPYILKNNLPTADHPAYVHPISLQLTKPGTYERAIRSQGYSGKQPHDISVGILSRHPFPKLPSFVIFDRAGEVTITVEQSTDPVSLSNEQLDLVQRFHRYVFTDVVRLDQGAAEEPGMTFDTQANSYGYYIVLVENSGTGGPPTGMGEGEELGHTLEAGDRGDVRSPIVPCSDLYSASKKCSIENLDECDHASTEELNVMTIEKSSLKEVVSSSCVENSTRETVVTDSTKDSLLDGVGESVSETVTVKATYIRNNEYATENDGAGGPKWFGSVTRHVNEVTTDECTAEHSGLSRASEDESEIRRATGSNFESKCSFTRSKQKIDIGRQKVDTSSTSRYSIAFQYLRALEQSLGSFDDPQNSPPEKTNDYEVFRNRVVTATYALNQLRYYIVDICYDESPASPFPAPLVASTFGEYYKGRYDVDLSPDQPLLDVDHVSVRLNFLKPRYQNIKGKDLTLPDKDSKRYQRSRIFLMPEMCSIHPIPAPLWRNISNLPSILYRLESLLLADELRQTIAIEAGIGIPVTPKNIPLPVLTLGETVGEVIPEGQCVPVKALGETVGEVIPEGQYVPVKALGETVGEVIPEGQYVPVKALGETVGEVIPEGQYVPVKALGETVGEVIPEGQCVPGKALGETVGEIIPEGQCVPGTALGETVGEVVLDVKPNFVRHDHKYRQADSMPYRDIGSEKDPRAKSDVGLVKMHGELNDAVDASGKRTDDAPSVSTEDWMLEKGLRNLNMEDNTCIDSIPVPCIAPDETGSTPCFEGTYSDLGPSSTLILRALTCGGAGDIFNHERLELYGDAFIKHAVSTRVYCDSPCANEGNLSFLRGLRVTNQQLFYLGRCHGIPRFIFNRSMEHLVNWFPPGFSTSVTRSELNSDTLFGQAFDLTTSEPDDVFDEEEEDDASAVGQETINESQPAAVSTPFDPYRHLIVSDKIVADTTEAVIGSYLLTNGIQGALQIMEWLGVDVVNTRDKKLATVLDENSDVTSCHSVPKDTFLGNPASQGTMVGSFDPIWDDSTEMCTEYNNTISFRSSLGTIEETLGYTFKDKTLLLQAFTHTSYPRDFNSVRGSYEQLEFLGDALLDFLVTRHLLYVHREFSPGALTDLRSAVVNNYSFSSLVVKHGFHKHLRALSLPLFRIVNKFVSKLQEMERKHMETKLDQVYSTVFISPDEEGEDIEVPKPLGDLFEALTGAIFVDSGMDEERTWRVVYPLLRPIIEHYSCHLPVSPVRQLHEMFPQAVTLTSVHRTVAGLYTCSLSVKGVGKFTGKGRNARIAKSSAAQRALSHVQPKQTKPTTSNIS